MNFGVKILLIVSIFSSFLYLPRSPMVESAFCVRKTVFVSLPENKSGDRGIDWLSRTFGRAIQLEMRKGGMRVRLVKEIPQDQNADFLVISSYSKSKDGRRIIVYVNVIGKGDFLAKSGEYGLVDTFSFSFIPEVVYEAKTYISRTLKLYTSGLAKGLSKFNPVKYKFSPEKLNKLTSLLSELQEKGAEPSDEIVRRLVFEPEEVGSFYTLGIGLLRNGRVADGLSFLLRYISKKGVEFSSEEDILKDQKISSLSKILALLLPGSSKDREEAVKNFVLSQLYRDFSDNEVKHLEVAVSKDIYFWPAMRRLGEIYFARGDFKSSLRYFRDYISTSNESFSFILAFSKVVSFVDELARGF